MNEFQRPEDRPLKSPQDTEHYQNPSYNIYKSEPLMQEAIRKNMTGYFKNRTNTIIAIWLSILIGVLVSFLIVEYKLRLNVFIFYTILLAVTGYIMHRDNNLAVKPFIFFSAAFLCMASAYFRYTFYGYIGMGIVLLPVVYVLLTVYSSKHDYASDIKAALFRGVCSIGFIHMIVVAIASLKRKDDRKKKLFLHILIGVGITAVLLTIILPLMLSADEMFKVKLFDMFGESNIGTFILKTILSAFIAMLFFGFLYLITAHRFKQKEKAKPMELPSVTAVIITIILALAVVFTFFAVVQFRYLFGGVTSDLPDNFSYAQYAREGYFQLVVLSILNFAIILSCIFFSKKGNLAARRTIKIILTYFNLLNIYLLVSAAYKMKLYQNEFGMTTSRFVVYILLLFEAILIIALMVKIFMQNMNYVKLAVFFSVGFWAIVSLVNVEAVALKYNINNLYPQGKLDFEYMEYRSPDASRVLYDFYIDNHEELSEDELYSLENYFDIKHSANVARSVNQYDKLYSDTNWREFNISTSTKHVLGKQLIKQFYE